VSTSERRSEARRSSFQNLFSQTYLSAPLSSATFAFCRALSVSLCFVISANENTILKNKLSKLDKRDVTLYQKCKKVLDDFVAKGVMAIENEEEEIYLTLNSFMYIQNFCESIKEVGDD
jgi:hypothetical protein